MWKKLQWLHKAKILVDHKNIIIKTFRKKKEVENDHSNLFSGKTQYFIKREIKNMLSRSAAVVENEGN